MPEAPPLSPYSGASGSRPMSSYASVVQGTAAMAARANAQRTSSQSAGFPLTSGGSYQPAHTSSSHSRHQSRTMDNDLHPSGLSGSWGRSGHLPTYSNNWSGLASGLDEPKLPPFFIPSYLRGSRQARRLEQAHAARVAAQKDLRSAHSSNAASLSTSSSSLNLHKMVPSHRGMTHDIIERAVPPVSFEEMASPLPSRWAPSHEVSGLDLGHSGLEARYTGLTKQHDEAAVVRGDHPIPKECGIFYFEVTVGTKQKESAVQISIGLSAPKVTLRRMPGWEPESYGYMADDGCLLLGASNSPKKYGPSYGNGDVVGCGINFRTGNAFFTKNGVHLGTAIPFIKGDRLYPAVGLKRGGDHLRVNFGQSQFVFDIDSYVEAERESIMDDMNTTPVDTLSPPLTEPQLIHKLIAQYLAHDGYIETARAFASEVRDENQNLSIGTGERINGQNLEPEEDHGAIHRQKIRSAILDGNIARALKYTDLYYPNVLHENENIKFRLRCREFIEMIRRCAEMSDGAEISPTIVPSKGQHHNNNDDHNGVFDHQMELDGQDQLKWEDDVAEMAGAHGSQPTTYGEMINKTLEYGVGLKAEFDADPRREVKRTLEETLALIGYQDPRESPLRHLLAERERSPVAEELNSAILVSLGKSSSSALEKVFAQTDVLLDLIGQDGGAGALIDLRSTMGRRGSYRAYRLP